MHYLFFDTETTGLPVNFDAPVEHLSNWPRIVQLAWLLADEDGNTLDKRCYIVQPEGFEIPRNATAIHGISTITANARGKALGWVLDFFNDGFLCRADRIVCHNYDFDAPILGAEFIRKLRYNPIPTKAAHCTQKQSTSWAQIPSRPGNRGTDRYKWPSLAELHAVCGFGDIEGAHDALVDVEATARCFFHIRQHSPAVFYAPYKPAQK